MAIKSRTLKWVAHVDNMGIWLLNLKEGDRLGDGDLSEKAIWNWTFKD
jgi:hypothetical protein